VQIYLDRSGQPAAAPAELLRHAHDHLPAEAVPDQELREQLEPAQQAQHVAGRRIHAVRPGRPSRVPRRLAVAAQVDQQDLP
jgi:hypothetical protein